MVLKPEPLCDAVARLRTPQARVVLMTPQGRPFSQRLARALASEQHLVLICSHYEGVDERVRQIAIDDELSIGDFVLTNGNLAAMVVADAVIRLLPGALGSQESTEQESFSEEGWLEYPHYTRPEKFQGMAVPDLLRSGNHQAIRDWRRAQRLVRTIARRPDLLMAAVEETQHGPESSENPQ
jgi:tRNA (guanine37-N1)-methyltransferase